jgi:hypothetical protein
MDVRNERGEALVLKTYEGLAAAAVRKPRVSREGTRSLS